MPYGNSNKDKTLLDETVLSPSDDQSCPGSNWQVQKSFPGPVSMRLWFAVMTLVMASTMSAPMTWAQTRSGTNMAAPLVVPPADHDLKAKIEATQRARDALMRRFEAESENTRRADSKRDARLRKLSSSVCSGCGPGSRSMKNSPRAPRALTPNGDDTAPTDPALAGGFQ